MSVEIKIPEIGESITEATVARWLKSEGDVVERDEEIAELDTDKASVELPSPIAGILEKIAVQEGETVNVGDVIAYIDDSGDASRRNGQNESASREDHSESSEGQPADKSEQRSDSATESAAPTTEPTADRSGEQPDSAADRDQSGDGGRSAHDEPPVETRARILRQTESGSPSSESTPRAPSPVSSVTEAGDSNEASSQRRENVVPMSPIRRRIAQRLVDATQTAAMLTTFNEIDMSAVKDLRAANKDEFEKEFGVRLGFMSFFVKAVLDALRQFPRVNASIRNNEEIVYHEFYDIGIAVSTEHGLVVPILRNADQLSIAQIEASITDFATRARDRDLKLEELSGGTFTITNGGVFGSLLSTPILNPPQTGILGMHAIQDRPMAVNGEVVIRPMMYVALTYDHRLIDGREAVLFLRRIKDCIEQPARMLLGM